VLGREKLIAGLERTRELREVGRQLLLGFVKRVTRERLIALAPVVVHAALREVLHELAVEPEAEFSEAATQVGSIRCRKLV
jgi:hypothetical protein